MSDKVETSELKLESWMQFVILIVSIGIYLYYQKEKFKDTGRELDLLKQFSQTITYHKIDKALKYLGSNIPAELDRGALGNSLQDDLKILYIVKCQSVGTYLNNYIENLSPYKKYD